MNSGWMYFVNGEYMNIGMSGYFPADGDEVRLALPCIPEQIWVSGITAKYGGTGNEKTI